MVPVSVFDFDIFSQIYLIFNAFYSLTFVKCDDIMSTNNRIFIYRDHIMRIMWYGSLITNNSEDKKLKTVRKIWDVFTSILVGIVVVIAILLVGVRLIGLNVYTVLSGSMEPTYHTGSLIYVKKVDYTELKTDDIITFMLDEDTIATHRIVEVVPDENDSTVLRYRTKGDANDAVDGSLVHYKNVIGSPVFSIPKLGYLANYIQQPPGMYVAISAGAILMMLVFIPDLFTKEEEKK